MLNILYVENLAERLSFPKEGIESLVNDIKKINESNTANVLMQDAVNTFERTDYSFDGMNARLDSIGDASGIHKYSAAMLMLMLSCETLERKYAEKNYPESLFVDTMSDLKYKLLECKNVHNVYGTFVASWYPGFFRMTRFALGRFQYEIAKFKGKCFGAEGNYVTEGEPVLNFHIPSSGISLTESVRYDSYKKAKDFFFPSNENPVPFVCSSWLLYPGYENYLPENSNVLAFRHDFATIDSSEYQSFTNAWRVFGSSAEKDLSEWDRKTSMQRAFLNYVEDGKTHGSGYGVFFFDGERVIR